jgi:hypothetical protein
MPRHVTCSHCGEPVLSRPDLLVLGRILAPVHLRCEAAFKAARPWYRREWAMNRWSPFLAFNAGMLLLIAGLGALRPDVPLREAFVILAVANAWLLLGRIVAYVSLERHLPADPRPGSTSPPR